MMQLTLGALSLAFLIWIVSLNQAHDRSVLHDSRVVLITRQLEQLSTFGSEYAHQNTSTTGPVSLTTAGAPAWYVAPPGALLNVQGGTSYACMSISFIPDRAGTIGAIRGTGMLVGVSNGTSLTDGLGTTIATLPAGIPANDLCLIQ